MSRYFYAHVIAGRVVGVSDLSGPVDTPDMVPLESYDPALRGKLYADGVFSDAPDSRPRHITKRSFWNRFPASKEETMRAIIISGTPVLLAARLQRLQARVDGSPHVDLDLPETQGAIAMLASEAVPTSVLIDGVTLPLRLTAGEADAIINGAIADAEWAS